MDSPVVAVALSGGVDSLVSGFLMKQAHRKVFGIHFTTGYEKKAVDTKLLERQLGFKVHTVDLSHDFENQVVQYFVSTYLAGKTPNPCLVCNRKIKFGLLLDKAVELGADALATGHYATIANRYTFPDRGDFTPWLEKGKDPLKDQSYFLSMLGPEQLDRIIFPLANHTKEEIKALAAKNNLTPPAPSESQDICFIQNTGFAEFIIQKEKISPAPGNILDPSGKIVGTHKGLHTFTIGQRRGINCPAEKPYYVRQIDMASNTLHVCYKEDLAQESFKVREMVWNCSSQKISRVTTKIRYSHKGAVSTLIPGRDKNRAKVVFEKPQYAVTPGQAAVFYLGTRVVGAGIIQ